MHRDHEINRASWDELAAVHGQDAYYDTEALVAGGSSLIEEEEALRMAVDGNVAGRTALHPWNGNQWASRAIRRHPLGVQQEGGGHDHGILRVHYAYCSDCSTWLWPVSLGQPHLPAPPSQADRVCRRAG